MCLVFALGFLLLTAPVFAQRFTAAIRVTVKDSTGAVIQGATVTATSEETGFARSATTNAAGLCSFPELSTGRYRLRAEFPRFKKAVVTGILLSVAEERSLDVVLEPGELAEEVTVAASAVAVQTIGGDVSGLVTGEQVRELPLNGRNMMQLTLLQPGVSPSDGFNAKDKGLLGQGALAVSGNATTSNLWTVDGVNNNDVGSNAGGLVSPSVDAIEELTVHRNSYGAEFGQASGAQISIVTRGGTNELHGSAFYFGRDDALSERDYFLEKAGKPKGKLSRHDFGWTLGGPVIKNRLHVFVSQEWNREVRGDVRAAFVPTALERAGDFSEPGIPDCSSPAPIDPLTGEPFPGNRIPPDRLSPAGRLFLGLYALPNTTPGPGSCNNWVESVDTPIRWRQENIRLDWTIRNATRLLVRYTQDHWTTDAALWGDDPFPIVDSNWDAPGRSLLLQLSAAVGSAGTNTLRFSYSGNEITFTRGGTNPELNDAINAAIPPIFAESSKLYGASRGHPVFWGGAGYGPLANEAPFRNNQNLYVLRDDYSAAFGKHVVKAGVLASWNAKNEDVGTETPALLWSTGLNASGDTTSNLLADLLLRDMTFEFREDSARRRIPERWRDLEAYVADSWKLSPRMTLDLGLRYSRYSNPYTADDRIVNFQPALFDPALGPDPCNGMLQPPGTSWCQEAGFQGGVPGPNRSLLDEDRNLIAPRFGIAWDMFGTGRTALRAGVGQFFGREQLQPSLFLVVNPPFTNAASGRRTLDTAEEPCPGCFGTTAGVPLGGREKKALTPNSWQWNVSLQETLFPNTTLQLSYVGSKGTHLLRLLDANQVRAGDGNRNGIPDRLEYARTFAAELRPFGVFGDRFIGFADHGGSSIYHSLQTQLVSRFHGASQFQASYTWSRTIADVPQDSAFDVLLDVDTPRLDRGLAGTHRKHIFNSSLVLFLPSLAGEPGLVRHALGDWEIGAIAIAASGSPITVFTGFVPGIGGPSGTGDFNQRPNRVPGQPCRANGGSKEQWLNPNAFTLDGFELGTIGDGGRGTCEGPGLFQVDLAVYKNVRLSSGVKLQLRFEVFNVFNRTNFMGVDNSMDPTGITLDAPNESATRITGSELPNSFGQATAARDPRQAQFGIKLIF